MATDSPEKREPRILLVEDDPTDRMAVERLFTQEALPYELVCAGTIAEAMEIHREHPPDLAVLDHSLPDGTGLELQALLDGIPCVFITGQEDVSIAIEAMKRGAYDFLVKDTARTYVELLPPVIEKALELHRLREQIRRHTEELDDLVVARTRELEEANERLREEITERARAEKALRASESQLTESQRVAGLGSYSLDIPSGTWSSSSVLDEVFGIGVEYPRDLQGWLEIVHPDDRSMMQDYFATNVLADKERFDKAYRISRVEDGAERWVHGLGELGFDTDGNPVRMVGTIQDITDRKQVEDALRESEARARALLATVPDMMFQIRRDGTYLEYMPGRGTKLFASPEDFLGKTISDVMPADLAKREMQDIGRALDTGEVVEHEYKLLVGDELLSYEYRLASCGEDEVFALVRDITERKRAEEALHRSEVQLAESQRVAGLGSYSLELPSGTWSGSSVLDEVFGIGVEYPRDLQGWLEMVHPDDRSMMRDYFATNVLADHERFDKAYRINRVEDGAERWVHGLGELGFDTDGNPVRMVGTIQDITERKRAEREVLAVRDRLQLSIDRMPVGYIRWDTNRKVTHWNPAAERIFGFTSEEAIGRTLLELVIPEEVRPAVVEVLDRLVAGEEASYSEPGNNLRKDGSVISCQWFNTPLIEATGEVSGVLSMVLDVTERQLAEEALREANTIINLSPAVAFLWKNQEGWPVEYVSRNVKDLLGYTAQEFMAGDVSYASVIHADDLEALAEQLSTYSKEETIDQFTQEYRVITREGQTRWVDDRTRMRRNEEGEVTHYQGVVLDITDRKRAEEELRRNEVIVASSSDMLALLDKDYTYLAVNSAYLKAFGMTRDQLIGSTVSEVFGEERFKGVIRPQADRCLGGERVHFQEWFDFPVSGRVYMDVSYYPYVGADNEVRGFVVDARDITELEAARTKLREMNVELERLVEARTEQLVAANEELEAFAYSVSHDLKAPLRAIDGYSAMLEEEHGSSLGEDGQRLLGVVRSSAQQMARLIDDLLAFSRIGRVEMVISDVDMRELAQAVFSDLLNVSKLEGDRTVDFNLGELPTVRADLALMRQVWANLLDNALKFTGGREAARIEVDCQEEPDHWVFRVRDNGAGFDMEYVDKLFGVFQRLHYQEEFPGTGVGLATVQRVVQRHGGEVWAEGEVDRGATVFFRLPRSVKPT